MTAIEPGAVVTARTADGRSLPRRAISGVVDGLDFPVVWITTEEEWGASQGNGDRPHGLPWPAEDVVVADEAVRT